MFKTSRRSVVLVIPLLVLGICFGLRISIFGFESPALGGAVQIRPGGAPGQRAKPCLFSRGVGKGTPETRRAQRNWEGEAATANHLSVIDSQVTEIGLSLRPSRLCGLTGLSSTAWSRLRPAGLPKTRFAPQRQAGPRQSRKAKMLRPAGPGPVTLPADG